MIIFLTRDYPRKLKFMVRTIEEKEHLTTVCGHSTIANAIGDHSGAGCGLGRMKTRLRFLFCPTDNFQERRLYVSESY